MSASRSKVTPPPAASAAGDFFVSRRQALTGLGVGLIASPALGQARGIDPAPFRTPYKLGRLILEKSGDTSAFDSQFVDAPLMFRGPDRFYMAYYGFDGTGYQTGLAESDDLIHWRKRGIILARDPSSPITRYNVAMSSILREPDLHSQGRPIKVGGRYVASWNAYPKPGMEEGPAVIGLAWSDDLIHWRREPEPILRPEDGAPWEHAGLYKSFLTRDGGTYYLFYNAKTHDTPWLEQIGVATSLDLKNWKRHPGNPIVKVGEPGSNDARFAANPYVLRYRGMWAMYYYGYTSRRGARDLLAIGRDPFHFEKVSEPMIDRGPPGTVDETHAHKPSIIWHDGALYHFYCAVSGQYPNEVRGISVARSKPW
ncbi:hypothetical protein [Sphingomonas sp. dw_22]|uniref:glycoside hydrolase family 130 protein n=1 Tax=Sphingomonas sp. dw_22 TaxID=2721175 RepID=UPI0031FEC511